VMQLYMPRLTIELLSEAQVTWRNKLKNCSAMVRLLNLGLSISCIAIIKAYKAILSKRIKRNCIYEKTCSSRSIDILRKNTSFLEQLSMIRLQISGCKITQIIPQSDSNTWYVINGNGDRVEAVDLNHHTRLDISQTIKSVRE